MASSDRIHVQDTWYLGQFLHVVICKVVFFFGNYIGKVVAEKEVYITIRVNKKLLINLAFSINHIPGMANDNQTPVKTATRQPIHIRGQ